MKYFGLALFSIVLTVQFGFASLAVKSPVTAIVNVHVIPMDTERVLEGHTVIVDNGLIVKVGPAGETKIPENAKIIDGKGGYLIPGLADMHTHLTFDDDPKHLSLYLAQGVTTVRNLNGMPTHLGWREKIERGDLLGPTIYLSGRVIVGPPDEIMKALFVAMVVLFPVIAGIGLWLLFWVVSRVRNQQKKFAEIKRHRLPSLFILLLIGAGLAWFKIIPLNLYLSQTYPMAYFPETEWQAREEVRKQQKAGYDFIKVYDWLEPKIYLATLDEARKRNIYVIGHFLDGLTVKEAVEGGLREFAHVDEFLDPHMIGESSPGKGFNEVKINYETIDDSVATVKEGDVMVVSNMVTDETSYLLLENPKGLLSQPEYSTVRPETLDAWHKGRAVSWQGQQEYRRNTLQPFLMTMIKRLHDAGVIILTGTDTSTLTDGSIPYHIHRDLELLVEAGLSPYEALQAGTRNAGLSVARMGQKGNFGVVAVGNRADLVLLVKNPLENISSTRRRIGVMVRGKWFTQQELDAPVDKFVSTY